MHLRNNAISCKHQQNKCIIPKLYFVLNIKKKANTTSFNMVGIRPINLINTNVAQKQNTKHSYYQEKKRKSKNSIRRYNYLT